MVYIPGEIIMEIILRLPFESMIAFMLVSKQWLNLINSPKFFTRYNGRPAALFVNKNHIYCVLLVENNKRITSGSHLHPPISVRRLPIESKLQLRPSTMAIAANWTFCSETENMIFFPFHNLFNRSDAVAQSDMEYYMFICHGYGYDAYDDDYKLFVVSKQYNNGQYRVYSLRNRAWKILYGFPHGDYVWMKESMGRHSSIRACSFNGVLHWVVAAAGKEKLPGVFADQPVIVTYDMHTFKFGEISPPVGYVFYRFPTPDGYNCYRLLNLSELGGKLCCWVYAGKFEMWVMNEYGVRESWMKLCSIHYSRFGSDTFCSKIEPTAIYESEDGGKSMWLVNYHYGSVYWYDIGKNKVEVIQKSIWLKRRVIGGRKGRNC